MVLAKVLAFLLAVVLMIVFKDHSSVVATTKVSAETFALAGTVQRIFATTCTFLPVFHLLQRVTHSPIAVVQHSGLVIQAYAEPTRPAWPSVFL
jgi:hypothetical protein